MQGESKPSETKPEHQTEQNKATKRSQQNPRHHKQKTLTKRRRPRDAGHKRTTRAGRPSKPYNAVPNTPPREGQTKLLAVIPLHTAQNIQTIQRYDRFGDSVQQNATHYCCLGNNADRALHWVATNSFAACF